MRPRLLSAALVISLVFAAVRAAPGPADSGGAPLFFFLQNLHQQTRELAEHTMGPGFGPGIPAQAVTTSATAATETDPKGVAAEPAGRAGVVAADRSRSTLTRLDFDRVDVGQSRDKALTVHNTGTGALAVTTLTIRPPNSSFSVVPPPVCSPDCFTVAPGGEHSVAVRFRPTADGEQSGELSIASNDPDTATVSIQLQGVGRGVPNIIVDPVQLDFDFVDVGQSRDEALTVRNTGTGTLSVTSITHTPPFPPFSVPFAPAVPFTVAPGGEQAITVRFSPTAHSVYHGEFSIASDDPDTATVLIPLQGVGMTGPCPPGLKCCECCEPDSGCGAVCVVEDQLCPDPGGRSLGVR
jgi:large repetitive protein